MCKGVCLSSFSVVKKSFTRFGELFGLHGRTGATSAQTYRLYRVDVLVCSDAAFGILPEKRILERRSLSLVMKKGKPNRVYPFFNN